jgi:hypothetical protein
MIHCEKCQHQIQAADKYCSQCGTPAPGSHSPPIELGTTGMGLWEKTDALARLSQRVLSSFSTIYITLASVIQGSIFVLLVTYSALNFTQWKTAVPWLQVASTYIIVMILWHMYLLAALSFVWVVTIFDTIIHFTLGAAEMVLVFSISDDPHNWLGSVTIFAFLGTLAVAYTDFKSKSSIYREENRHALKFVGHWNRTIVLLTLTACLVFGSLYYLAVSNESPIAGYGLQGSIALSSIAFGQLVIYIFVSAAYWHRIVKNVNKILASEGT